MRVMMEKEGKRGEKFWIIKYYLVFINFEGRLFEFVVGFWYC